jgi:hypothetical protein
VAQPDLVRGAVPKALGLGRQAVGGSQQHPLEAADRFAQRGGVLGEATLQELADLALEARLLVSAGSDPHHRQQRWRKEDGQEAEEAPWGHHVRASAVTP